MSTKAAPSSHRSGRRVAVVGAGPAGLATAKELLAEGHSPTVYEKRDGLGGVFLRDEVEGCLWDSVRLTSSGLLTAFSDFPVPAERTRHMSADEYADYLRRYAERFGVLPQLRTRTNVEAVTREAAGGWTVRARDASGVERSERHDAVAVACGQFQRPRVPQPPGQENFPGAILHSSQYRRPVQVAGRRVLVVGGGESGADIVAEVAQHAAATALSLRRGAAVLPRERGGLPNDFRTARINNCAAHWIFQTRNPLDEGKRRVYRRTFLPLVALDKLIQSATFGAWERLPLLDPRGPRGPLREIRSRLTADRVRRRLLAESGGAMGEQFATKSDAFLRALADGRCRRVGPVERFEGSRVAFAGGEAFEADMVIWCTGFEPGLSFLDPELATAPRFLHTFVPEVGPSLAFVGFVRPALGAVPPLAELQARWFARVLSGHARLPEPALMHARIAELRSRTRHVYRTLAERLPRLVDFTSFCDELAAEVGCLPTRAALARESMAFRYRFYAGPFVAAQYRLVGPHAKPELARSVIGSLPVAHSVPMLALYYLRWRLSRRLHGWLGPEYAPKLALPGA
jgi:dimethylaniline monooxygenase (N-oxide forming)